MVPASQLRVIVDELEPHAFSWTLLERKETDIIDVQVAHSPKSFPEFDLALEDGFLALKELTQMHWR
ncbi:hypothetical protein SAMN05216567_114107 [Variovorax sp. OK605]|jgi:hypothetical protein|uniref:hypothetical protein n=1 Tax=unclassified Variovorax TaxID=663243 RepID=UPI0008C426AD|nr:MULTISPECIES: hypothetical protein [unclassified Variovorax]SEK14691.1 hypothetical protein SAMN05518853_11547 [Variovorax sp. OK202]SFE02237.1 hypothetical protein SAMN05444746_11547 [Variovorax sp. OK212]SFQ35266.1 hypothetical protein SAMN05216567_114107 [Variovorax sp. OK605]